MFNIPRLRTVLKKFDSKSDLAKYFVQRVSVGAVIKEYGLTISFDNFPYRLLSQIVTSPYLSPFAPFSKIDTQTQAARPTEISVVSTEKEKQKITKATLFYANLFWRSVGRGTVIKLLNKKDDKTHTMEKYQTNHNASEAVKETANEDGAANNKHFDEKNPCKDACGDYGEDQDQHKLDGDKKPWFKSNKTDILHFMELLGNLKHTKRTGWVLRNVKDCESISAHMYRMSLMTFLLEENEGLNRIRCMELALIHDLAESLVGDLTPFCGVAKEDKKSMELEAMTEICTLVNPRGKRIMELFQEYEDGQSAESKFVKDLDRLDMVMQAFEYEKRDNCLMKHQEFFDSTAGKFQHPFVQELVKEILDQRKSLFEANLVAKGELNIKTVTPSCPPSLKHKNETS